MKYFILPYIHVCLNFVNLAYFNYENLVSSTSITNMIKFDITIST